MNTKDVATARIYDRDTLRLFRRSDVARADDGRGQANGDRSTRPIEHRIIRARGNDIFRAMTWNCSRNEIAHEQPCDRGIAVGKMERGQVWIILIACGRV